jgi:hypothetical protein
MEREVHGHSPSVIFGDRAKIYIDIPAIPAPAGMPAPTPNTGEAYIRQSDGTPELKRSLNFTASIEENAGTEPITVVRSTNPDYVSDQAWKKLQAWVHNWILQRIPEEHQHLVDGVKEGDIKDLLVKVFGLAARDPQQYCKAVKQKMKQQQLTMETFDLVAHHWTLDQYEMFDTIQDADYCMGEYKVAPTDFVEHMMEAYKPFMPSFAMIQEHDEIRGESWTVDILKDRIKGMAARGILRVEDSVRKEHAEKKVGANKTGATGYGVNDHSSHAYEDDPYWEEDEVKRDGELRYDSYGYYSSPAYGKGDYEQYPTNRDRQTKGRGDRRGKGRKGDRKGRKGNAKGKGDRRGKDGRKGRKGDAKGKGGGCSKGAWGGKDSRRQSYGGGGYGDSDEMWVPPKEMHCTICHWNDAPHCIYSKHEDATCNKEGGGMEGYSINAYIAEQKRLNRRYYDRKRD